MATETWTQIEAGWAAERKQRKSHLGFLLLLVVIAAFLMWTGHKERALMQSAQERTVIQHRTESLYRLAQSFRDMRNAGGTANTMAYQIAVSDALTEFHSVEHDESSLLQPADHMKAPWQDEAQTCLRSVDLRSFGSMPVGDVQHCGAFFDSMAHE